MAFPGARVADRSDSARAAARHQLLDAAATRIEVFEGHRVNLHG
jgi:hypothetical protein